MAYADPAVQRAYQNRWLKERREAWFSENGPCIRCGSWEHLHAHHRDPAQKVDHRIWGWTEARRVEELAKCDVLCRLCHMRLHHPQQHGTRGCYDHGCRCDACRAANTARRRRQVAEKRAGGVIRTPTSQGSPAFEAGASTSSATPAGGEDTDD